MKPEEEWVRRLVELDGSIPTKTQKKYIEFVRDLLASQRQQQTECELCGFENPKASVTAVIIRKGKLFLLERGEDPYKGMWDFPGGYMQKGEMPEQALAREIHEELGIIPRSMTYLVTLPGTGLWRGKKFPIINIFYLVDIGDLIPRINKKENVFGEWMPFDDIPEVAWDSNQRMVSWIKENIVVDIERVKELVSQLDSFASVNEQSFYKAVCDGHVAKRYDEGRLVGMGWIFPRQTMLRRQAVVEDMIVDEAHRGKGLGWAILDDLVKWARDTGVEVIELTSNPKREAANKLYKKYGFVLHPTNHYLYKT